MAFELKKTYIYESQSIHNLVHGLGYSVKLETDFTYVLEINSEGVILLDDATIVQRWSESSQGTIAHCLKYFEDYVEKARASREAKRQESINNRFKF